MFGHNEQLGPAVFSITGVCNVWFENARVEKREFDYAVFEGNSIHYALLIDNATTIQECPGWLEKHRYFRLKGR